jgi:hypothetical protein
VIGREKRRLIEVRMMNHRFVERMTIHRSLEHMMNLLFVVHMMNRQSLERTKMIQFEEHMMSRFVERRPCKAD